MSFDTNPYHYMAIITDKEDDVMVRWHCESCGGEGKTHSAMHSVAKLRDDWLQHVEKSHCLTRELVKDWHSY